MTQKRQSPSVLVVQIGARHNYAAPIIFSDANQLEAFYTDMNASVGAGRFLSFLARGPFPESIKRALKNIQKRRLPDTVAGRTKTIDGPSIKYEIRKRRAGSEKEALRAQLQFRDETNALMARWGLGEASHVYSIYGEGHDLLVKANAADIPVVSDIVIALSTAEIEEQEHQLFPDWGERPFSNDEIRSAAFQVRDEMLDVIDFYICPSQFVADDLIQNHKVNPDRVFLLPYALSSEWFDIVPAPEEGRILFVGSATRRKGIHYLAKSANQLKQAGHDFDFRVAGGVPDKVKHHPEAQSLNFLGRVPRDKIKSEFSQADIFVLPSLAEGSATVVYEAMSAGLAIITTKSSGSVIRDGETGLIIPERDPDAISKAIVRLSEDRELRNRLAKAAREDSLNYNWESYSQGLVSIIERIPSPDYRDRDKS